MVMLPKTTSSFLAKQQVKQLHTTNKIIPNAQQVHILNQKVNLRIQWGTYSIWYKPCQAFHPVPPDF